MKKTRAELMIENIKRTQGIFLLMSSEERLKFLDRYSSLQPYQKTALLQCRKYMSAVEKRKFKQMIEKSASSINSNDEPQPN